MSVSGTLTQHPAHRWHLMTASVPLGLMDCVRPGGRAAASSVKESWFARGGVDGIILLVSAAYDEDPHMRRSDRLSTPSRT